MGDGVGGAGDVAAGDVGDAGGADGWSTLLSRSILQHLRSNFVLYFNFPVDSACRGSPMNISNLCLDSLIGD